MFFGTLALSEQDTAIADKVLREIVKRLHAEYTAARARLAAGAF